MEFDRVLERKEVLLKAVKLIRPIDVLVILSSIIAMYLFRIPDGFVLNPIWQLRKDAGYQADQVQPLIADLDGNSLKELLIASQDKIEMFSFHADEFDDEHDVIHDQEDKNIAASSVLYHLHQKGELSFSKIHGGDGFKAFYPVAMNSGCVATSHNVICPQVLAIVWNDWTVTLLSHNFNVLWRAKPLNITFEPQLKITEMSVHIAAGNKSVFGEKGLVIVGGVLNLKDHATADATVHVDSRLADVNQTAEEISRERAGVEPEFEREQVFSHHLGPELAKYVGHFTTYALDATTGAIKWKHEPGDFEPKPEHNEDNESPHFKLRLRKKSLHHGEVHWKKYSQSLLNHLPYSWTQRARARISLGEFKRSTLKPLKARAENVAEELVAWAKTETPTESPIRDPNSVVIKHSRGIDVLDLDKGRPVCSLPLDSKFSTLADVNDDGSVDVVRLHVVEENSKLECFLVACDALRTSSVLFNSSVCSPTHFASFMQGESTSSVSDDVKHLPPLVIRKLKRSSGILRHVLGHGLPRRHVGMDTVVLTSSGKLTAFEPNGRFLWQIDTGHVWFETDSFTPSMHVISLSGDENTQDGLVVLGLAELVVISLVDGSIVCTHSLPCVPTQSLVLGDLNNDINDEFLVQCSDRYIAFSLQRHNRIWLTGLMYSGVACVVAFVLFIIKYIDRDEFPFDTLDNVFKTLRLFPLQGTKL